MNYKIVKSEHFVKGTLVLSFPWIKELRNPANKQTTGKLKSDDGGECCLGLACRLMGILKKHEDGGYIQYYNLDNDSTRNYSYISKDNPLGAQIGESGDLPSGFTVICDDWKRDGEDITYKKTFTYLAELNDNGFTFAEIADIILEAWNIEYENPEHQH